MSQESQKENWKRARACPTMSLWPLQRISKRELKVIDGYPYYLGSRSRESQKENWKNTRTTYPSPFQIHLGISKRELKVKLRRRREWGEQVGAQNLKKRIESGDAALLLGDHALDESQKENWKRLRLQFLERPASHRNLKKRIESWPCPGGPGASISRCESQKENWKMMLGGIQRHLGSIGESQKENWKLITGMGSVAASTWVRNLKKRIESTISVFPLFSTISFTESQKENWKYSISIRYMSTFSSPRNLKKRIERQAPWRSLSPCPTRTESQKENWKTPWAGGWAPRPRYALESQKENWKLAFRCRRPPSR